jgi:hypothetical protein
LGKADKLRLGSGSMLASETRSHFFRPQNPSLSLSGGVLRPKEMLGLPVNESLLSSAFPPDAGPKV